MESPRGHPSGSASDGRVTPLAGREKELSVLGEGLEAASRCHGSVVLIGGEPGVGKSRLVSEFSETARSKGWLVLTGSAYDADGSPPYLPFIEALQGYVRLLPLDDLREQLGDAAPEVGLLLPEVLRRLPDVTASPSLEAQSERYRLFESMSAFLAAVAYSEANGILLCLEDLQWADQSSLLLLEHATRRLGRSRALTVATYRDTEVNAGSPLALMLEQMARRDSFKRVGLMRLTRTEASSMLAGLGPPDPPDAVIDAFYRETEGNPFYVRAVFEYLDGEGRIFDSTGRWQRDLQVRDTDVPYSAGLIVGRRLESVSTACRDLLGLSAVVGRAFNFELLRTLTELDEDTLLRVIDEAVAAHLLASTAESVVFAHELIRQTLFSSLTLPRRQAYHLRIAAAIEELYVSDLDPYLGDLAGHYGSGGTSAALEKTVDYASRAGDRATRMLAFEEALRFYDVALEALSARNDDASEQDRLTDLAVKRADTLVDLARWVDSRAALQAAAARASGLRRVRVLISLAVACLRLHPDVPLGRSTAHEIARMGQELGQPELEASARALLAQFDLADGNVRSALAQFDQAFREDAEAHRVETGEPGEAHDRLPKFRRFDAFSRGLYWAGRSEEAVERGREVVAAAREARDSVADAVLSADLGLSLTSSGRYAEALETFASARQRAEAFGAPGIRPAVARIVGMSCVVPMSLFDYDGAEVVAEEARTIAKSVDFVMCYISLGLDLLFVYARRGETDRADAIGDEIEEKLHLGVGAHEPIWRSRLAAGRAEAALMRGNLQAACSLASDAIELALDLGRPKYEVLSLTTRGRALAGIGKRKDGLADLGRAIEVARSMGDPAAFLWPAAALLALDGGDDLATEAREVIERILADLPEDRKARFEASEPVQAVRDASKAKARGGLRRVFPDGLSGREVEVLQFVAAGKSNREIAEYMVLSVRTIERHIANIYTKCGVHSKAQATDYAHRRGLT